jgi:3-oxoacyl-[acyl-carrier-protein] synthase-1
MTPVPGRKVAIVGMGGAFPDCADISVFNEKLFAGKSLIREWPKAVAYNKQIRSMVSGYIAEEELGIEPIYSISGTGFPETYVDTFARIPNINLATADLGCIWAMLATLDAIKQAGWTTAETESEQTGVVVASGGGGHVVLRHAWHAFFELGKKSRIAGSHTVDRAMAYREAANISCLIKNKGVCESVISACATGLGNIGYAYRLIKFGLQDRAIAGGVEGTAIETFIGFDAMQVLSKGFAPAESSRPFDTRRNGFVCSFGAGIVALEEYEMAKARGAKIYAVIDEYFNNSDGDGNMFYPSYDGQRRLWKGLMAGAHIKPDVVKVHGTATPVGDILELIGVVDTLGGNGYHVSAPKSQFGHMLGAAGSVEIIASILMLENQQVLPCINSDDLNTELENFQKADGWQGSMEPAAAYRHLIPQTTLAKEINQIVCLNYGFGGTNSAMAISRDV